MNNNGLKKIGRIIGIVIGCIAIISAVVGTIYGVAVYAQNLENGIKENKKDNMRQDTVIVSIESKVDYLVKQAERERIKDSLLQPELMAKVYKIMEKNTSTIDTTINVYSTDNNYD